MDRLYGIETPRQNSKFSPLGVSDDWEGTTATGRRCALPIKRLESVPSAPEPPFGSAARFESARRPLSWWCAPPSSGGGASSTAVACVARVAASCRDACRLVGFFRPPFLAVLLSSPRLSGVRSLWWPTPDPRERPTAAPTLPCEAADVFPTDAPRDAGRRGCAPHFCGAVPSPCPPVPPIRDLAPPPPERPPTPTPPTTSASPRASSPSSMG